VQLILTFPPHPDASGLGYYRHLSAENGLSGWRELAQFCETSQTRSGLLAQPEQVASRLGLDPVWTSFATAQEEASRAWTGLRRAVHEAVCPSCLKQASFSRLAWEHMYMVACPEHAVTLLDHCDDCGERLSVNRSHIERCECGADLTVVTTPAATPAQMWLATLIASRGASSGTWAPQMTDVQLDVTALVVRTLCLFYDVAAAPPKQNAAHPKTVAQAIEFLRPLDWLLWDWPVNFEKHVSDRIRAGHPEARTLNSLLGLWYQRLKGHTAGSSLVQFMEAIARVAASEFDGLMGLDKASMLLAKQNTHMLASQAAKQIGMHRATLVSRLQAGQVKHRTKLFGTRGVAYEIPKEEVEAIVLARRGWVSKRAACEILGVPEAVLGSLEEAGLVVSDSQWRSDARKGGPVSRDSLTQFIASLKSHRVSNSQEEGGRIALRELTGRRVGDHKSIAAALRAIASGEIRPVARADFVGSMLYPVTLVGRYFSTPMLDAGLSVQALSKLTGWKWESVSHWMDVGLLESNNVTLRGQPCRVVMPAQLLDFCRTYLPLADVARKIGSKSSALAEKLEGVEIIGAKPLPDGQRRGGLLRVTDLARLAMDHKRLESAEAK
jgi:hypothetical protein